MIRHQFKTQDDVTLNAVETGNPLGQTILFVHGLSQSWPSWMAQFADPQLRERFRLVALDLRDHGVSQSAFGAIDQEGNPLAALSTMMAMSRPHPARGRMTSRRRLKRCIWTTRS
jgi:pimeloyl-ACP methyl ester carboxylesterase